MSTQIFVNLPVKNLAKSIRFFEKVGYSFNPQFTDDSSACMIISDNIFAMLLAEDKFKTFTPKEVCDAKKSTEVLVALSCESREKVNDLVSKAIAAGGSKYREPKDHGFMYENGFEDPDGHIWEIFYFDPTALPQG